MVDTLRRINVPEQVKMNIATVITLCVALVAAAWAVSTEVHNYRLQNITERVGNHEVSIMDLKLGFAEVSKDISYIRESVDTMMRGH
jgi:hypothetical protein